MNKKIKVMIVDDSILFRKVLTDNLSKDPDIEVAGYAVDAFDAERKIPLLRPEVITLDVEMPGLSGIDFLKKLLPVHPIPIILVSSLNLNVFEALSAGAVDFVRKPDMSKTNSVQAFLTSLSHKIHIASRAKVRMSCPGASSPVLASQGLAGRLMGPSLNSMVVAIGASTGGTEATLQILKDLPAQTPAVLVTQHMPEGFTKMYADRLNRLCHMEVREAKNGDGVSRGTVLIAPGDLQMKLVRNGTRLSVSCYPGEKVSGHRPSVDVLFSSVAEAAGANAVGVILTGMGQDGAEGLLKMKKKGAYTIGQDKDSCVVYGMPMVAYNIGAVNVQASCSQISRVLLNHLTKIESRHP